MREQNELRCRKILMNNGRAIPALGFGTLIPDAARDPLPQKGASPAHHTQPGASRPARRFRSYPLLPRPGNDPLRHRRTLCRGRATPSRRYSTASAWSSISAPARAVKIARSCSALSCSGPYASTGADSNPRCGFSPAALDIPPPTPSAPRRSGMPVIMRLSVRASIPPPARTNCATVLPPTCTRPVRTCAPSSSC